jgi:hypothetical protein
VLGEEFDHFVLGDGADCTVEDTFNLVEGVTIEYNSFLAQDGALVKDAVTDSPTGIVKFVDPANTFTNND